MTSQPSPSFAVVIPAFNEEKGIAACVRAVDTALERLPNRSVVIVVDDGSQDGTAAVLDALRDEVERLVVLDHRQNRGYGAGLGTGVREAARLGFEYVLFMDSDLTNDPGYLGGFADRMAEGVDVVKASRYVRGGGAEGVPGWRSAASRLGNLVARSLYGIPVRDCTNGFRAVRTSLLARVDLSEPGFAVIMEELHRLRPLVTSYAEVPIVLTSRSGELRPSSFSFGPRAMAAYLKYPLLSARDRAFRT